MQPSLWFKAFKGVLGDFHLAWGRILIWVVFHFGRLRDPKEEAFSCVWLSCLGRTYCGVDRICFEAEAGCLNHAAFEMC